ncbi:hypothetical protein JOS77_14280 [Chromobacterium haemolyticum]|nr:hypothetical protein JOS77_14280 [Chromobacterium haemolyticum]
MTTPRNGRKPAQLELAGGKSPRQLAWETIRARRESFTLNDVACYADIDILTAKAYLQALERGGYISSTSPRRNTSIAPKPTGWPTTAASTRRGSIVMAKW